MNTRSAGEKLPSRNYNNIHNNKLCLQIVRYNNEFISFQIVRV